MAEGKERTGKQFTWHLQCQDGRFLLAAYSVKRGDMATAANQLNEGERMGGVSSDKARYPN